MLLNSGLITPPCGVPRSGWRTWPTEEHPELMALGLWEVGQRAQQDGVDDAEDGRVGADAQRERHQGDGREQLVPGEQVEAEADVLEE